MINEYDDYLDKSLYGDYEEDYDEEYDEGYDGVPIFDDEFDDDDWDY